MSECFVNGRTLFELERETKLRETHRYDSLVLLSYLIVLIISVITIWIFKHKRLRFVHETGLSLVYGLLLGTIFYYLPMQSSTVTEKISLPPVQNCSTFVPPDKVILQMNVIDNVKNKSDSRSFAYSFRNINNKNNTDGKNFDSKVTFDAEIFFNLLLPPIIFCAGYNMKKKHFFENFGAIFTFAFFGTVFSTFTIGAICFGITRAMPVTYHLLTFRDMLLFGSFISATDPVTVLAIFNEINVEVDLYALVFGESVLNDAVAIVLAESVENYGNDINGAFNALQILVSIKNFFTVFFGALSIGCIVGCTTAIVTKYTYLRDHPLLETTLFFLMSYCSFLSAEAAGLSGIVASLFCGITQAHYTFNNLSESSQRWTKEIFELLSFLSENFVFVYIGVSTITFEEHYWDPGFICVAMFSIIIGRVMNIYVLSAILNLGRSNKISWNKQHLLMFAGLRGAMAFALAIRNTSSIVRRMIFSTTLVIVMTTVFICGGFTIPMLGWLHIKMGKDNNEMIVTPEPINDSTILPNQILDLQERHKKKAFLIRMFANLDCKFIKPFLTHSPPLLGDTCSSCCLPITDFLTTKEQIRLNSSYISPENNFSMDGSLENTAFKSDVEVRKVNNGSGIMSPIGNLLHLNMTSRNHRNSDLDFILSGDDDNVGYMEGDESGLYIQNDQLTDARTL